MGVGASKAPIGREGMTPLSTAAARGDIDLVRKLSGKLLKDRTSGGLDEQDDDGNSALHWSCWHGHLPVAKFLLQKGCSVLGRNDSGNTPLHFACVRGHAATAKLLVKTGGAPVNSMTNDKDTCLILAAMGGHIDVIKYLVNEAGALLSSANREGYTALHYAAGEGHVEVVRFLAAKDECDTTARTAEGDTPLMFAMVKAPEIVGELIIRARPDTVNVQNNSGNTALHIACFRKRTAIARLLMRNGSDPLIPNADGDTCIDVAHKLKRSDITKILELRPGNAASATLGTSGLAGMRRRGHQALRKQKSKVRAAFVAERQRAAENSDGEPIPLSAAEHAISQTRGTNTKLATPNAVYTSSEDEVNLSIDPGTPAAARLHSGSATAEGELSDGEPSQVIVPRQLPPLQAGGAAAGSQRRSRLPSLKRGASNTSNTPTSNVNSPMGSMANEGSSSSLRSAAQTPSGVPPTTSAPNNSRLSARAKYASSRALSARGTLKTASGTLKTDVSSASTSNLAAHSMPLSRNSGRFVGDQPSPGNASAPRLVKSPPGSFRVSNAFGGNGSSNVIDDHQLVQSAGTPPPIKATPAVRGRRILPQQEHVIEDG